MSTVRLTIIGLLVAVAALVTEAASASAAVQHWYIGGIKLAESNSVEVPSKGTENFILRSKVGGASLKIECKKETSKGTIENPGGGGAGTDEEKVEFSECAVIEPTGCTVTLPIVAESKTKLGEFNGKAADEFKPEEPPGTNFTEITVNTCAIAGSYPVKGTDFGIAVNATSELEFTNPSSSLTLGVEFATLKGKSKLEAPGGFSVEIKP